MKIIIANSIGRDPEGNYFIHFPSRWTAKMGNVQNFSFYPYELAYLSTLLKRETKHNIKMLDGNLLGLKPNEYIKLISKEKPDWLIMETASPVYQHDLQVALGIKKKFKTKIIFCGQHPSAFPSEVIKDGVDYVCLGEFEYTVLDIINGKKRKDILGLYPNQMRPPLDVNSLPFPEDEDIKRIDYDHIGGCDYKEIEFFASRGCPFSCQFCVCGNLYYKRPNWRPRKIDSIISEIKYLKNKYPQMEGIFFDEEDHTVNKKFNLELCKAIIKNGLNKLHYNAMCGYSNLDEETLIAMKKAGYYKLRIGIETASEKVAKIALGKKIDIKKLKKVLLAAKNIGIQMYGTFTFGAPGSDKKEDQRTLNLIRELLDKDLLSDFQRSLCTPLPGTAFFKWAEKNNLLLSKNWDDYDGGSAIVKIPGYKPKDLAHIYKECGRIYMQYQLRKKHIHLIVDSLKKIGLKDTTKKIIVFLKNLI